METTTNQQEHFIREQVAATYGAEAWWADVFIGLGWTVKETRCYLDASSRDPNSPLRLSCDALVTGEVKKYAGERGIRIGGSVPMEVVKDGRIVYRARQVLSPTDQDAVVKEVSSYARVIFEPSSRGVYSEHGVAKTVRQITYVWLRRMIPHDARVLEVGASLTAAVMACVDPELYHAYTPVLGPRDSVRHSVEKYVRNVAKGVSKGFSAKQGETAAAFLADPSRFCTYAKIGSDSRQAEYILSNHSDYDIDLDDVPAIMAKHGARVWFGSIVRVEGLTATTGLDVGDVPVIGMGYKVDRVKDTIEFHFRGRASFAYCHKFSSFVKREERNDFRWQGVYHDYVYTRMPGTTSSTLMYAVFRVQRGSGLFREAKFAPTGMKGRVVLKSVRIVRNGGKWILRPYEFSMERLAFDKVIEYRRSLGVKGNVVSTLGYLRSVRVRFYINGRPVGVESALEADTYESAAIFIEACVASDRIGDDYDFATLMDAFREKKSERSLMDVLSMAVRDSVMFRIRDTKVPLLSSLKSWREALERYVIAQVAAKPTWEVCPEFVKLSVVQGVVKDSRDVVAGCVCREIKDVDAALSAVSALSVFEGRSLRAYRESLVGRLSECKCHERDFFREFNEWHASVDSSSDTCVDEDEKEEYFDCNDAGDSFPVFSERSAAIEEYSQVMRYQYDSVVEESERDAALMSRNGRPTTVELARFATGRRVPFLVRVENGRVIDSAGDGSTTEVSGIVDFDELKYHSVVTECKGVRRDVENVKDGWHYSSSMLRIMNGKQLSNVAQDVLGSSYPRSGVDSLELKFIVGPFGSGKTRRVVEELLVLSKRNASVLYLSATVASVGKVVSDLRAKDVDESAVVCKTMDSFLLNARETFDVVYVDEAPMVHAGQLLACLAKAYAKVAYLFGDFQQIPWCSFAPGFSITRADLRLYVEVVEKMSWLHRCPYDVLAAWYDLYEGGLKACVCCESVRGIDSSLDVVRISSVVQVPKRDDVRYLTFTHADKELLMRTLGLTGGVEVLRVKDEGGLSTVHEDQGGTHDSVVLVRLTARYDPKESPEMPSIFNRLAYALVATTRHRKKCTYYTVSQEDDMVCKRIRMSKDLLRRSEVLKV